MSLDIKRKARSTTGDAAAPTKPPPTLTSLFANLHANTHAAPAPVAPRATDDDAIDDVHVAENHRREIPEHIMAAGRDESDPDRRVLAMLAARGSHAAAAPVSQGDSSRMTVA
jgi:hypothetical protein